MSDCESEREREKVLKIVHRKGEEEEDNGKIEGEGEEGEKKAHKCSSTKIESARVPIFYKTAILSMLYTALHMHTKF